MTEKYNPPVKLHRDGFTTVFNGTLYTKPVDECLVSELTEGIKAELVAKRGPISVYAGFPVIEENLTMGNLTTLVVPTPLEDVILDALREAGANMEEVDG